MTASVDADLLERIRDIARVAGDAILQVYRTDFSVEDKDDHSPLTEADRVSHTIIRDGLSELTLRLPFLSEESQEAERAGRRSWTRYWLVDPLDGTKEFIKRNGEFTVNIALIDGHRPVLGVVLAPALDLEYSAIVGLGAYRSRAGGVREAINVRSRAATPLRVVGSRSHPSPRLAAFLETVGAHEMTPMGSSLKICLVAEGAADVYPRLGPTSEWDTAAAQAILEAAGGSMIDLGGQPLRYNTKEDLLNPHFLAFGDRSHDWLAAFRRD